VTATGGKGQAFFVRIAGILGRCGHKSLSRMAR
jgi:hypothetical protein